MIHIHEIDAGRGPIYYEVSENDTFLVTLQNDNELELYLDILRNVGVDFVLHTLEEYDEYHVALPSV